MVSDTTYTVGANSGRLTITDSSAFVKIFSAPISSDAEINEEIAKKYTILKEYGLKQIDSVIASLGATVPRSEYLPLVDFAIMKTIQGYDPGKEANLLTYFYTKIKGEVSLFDKKARRIDRAITRYALQSEDIKHAVSVDKDDSNKVILEQISNEESTEDHYINEDVYKRRLTAFKMAYSSLPLGLQVILKEIGNEKNCGEIAAMLNTTEYHIKTKRNFALGLILQKVMRSKHITDDEKQEICEFLNITYEDE